jgi:hypothetical protein
MKLELDSEMFLPTPPTSSQGSAALRTPEQWKAYKRKLNAEYLTRNMATFKPLFHNYYAAQGHEQRTIARNAMAAALLNEYLEGVTRKFQEVIEEQKDARNEAVVSTLRDLRDDVAQEMAISTVKILDEGGFESVGKLLGYIGDLITHARNRALDEVLRLESHLPLLSKRNITDEKGNESEEITDNTFGERRIVDSYGRSLLPSEPPDYRQQLLLESQGDVATTAKLMSLDDEAARQRKWRLFRKLRLADLQVCLINQFNVHPVPVAKTMAEDILPLIEIVNQRSKPEFPKSWAEAVQLKRIPKKRRVADDRPKSQWMSAVRCLFRLWCLEQGY